MADSGRHIHALFNRSNDRFWEKRTFGGRDKAK